MIRAGDAIRSMETLPFASLAAVTESAPVVILAPHPDDETLGCGGLIAAASAAGHPPIVLILTDGTGSHPNSCSYPPARLQAVREQEARDAVAILGLAAEHISFLGLRDTAAPMGGAAFDRALGEILSTAAATGATTILAPWEHDPHCDHLAAHRLAAAAAQVQDIRHLAYPVWGWTLPPDTLLPGSIPTGMRLDISDHLAAKRLAIAAHATQHRGLIDDDPTGFALPPIFLDLFNRPFETFLTVA